MEDKGFTMTAQEKRKEFFAVLGVDEGASKGVTASYPPRRITYIVAMDFMHFINANRFSFGCWILIEISFANLLKNSSARVILLLTFIFLL